jgi:hypothetical protein
MYAPRPSLVEPISSLRNYVCATENITIYQSRWKFKYCGHPRHTDCNHLSSTHTQHNHPNDLRNPQKTIQHSVIIMRITTILIAAFGSLALAKEEQFQFSHSCDSCYLMQNECMIVIYPLFLSTHTVAYITCSASAVLRSTWTVHAGIGV